MSVYLKPPRARWTKPTCERASPPGGGYAEDSDRSWGANAVQPKFLDHLSSTGPAQAPVPARGLGGTVTVAIAAGAAQDVAGNPSAAAVQFSIVADLTPVPALPVIGAVALALLLLGGGARRRRAS